MIEAVIIFGIIITTGIMLILAKLPRRLSLWLLGHHMWLDITITVLTLWIHFGTVTGLMAAAFAGLCSSVVTSTGKWLFGYRLGGKYYPGLITLKRTR